MNQVKCVLCVLVMLLLLTVSSVSVFAGVKVDVNKATAEQLVDVNGIGEVLAQRIIEYRQAHGNFKSLQDLDNVKGVGSKKLEKMLPYLVLSDQ